VTRRIKNYGIKAPQKSNGERRYKHMTKKLLLPIQDRYGLDLGLNADPDRPLGCPSDPAEDLQNEGCE